MSAVRTLSGLRSLPAPRTLPTPRTLAAPLTLPARRTLSVLRRGSATALVLVLLSSSPAFAQQPAGEPVTSISGGYAFVKDFSWNENLPIGWIAALTHRLNERLAIVGEVGGNHGKFRETDFTIQRYAFLGGVRLIGGEGAVKPFVQVLAGHSRQGGDVGIAKGFAVQAGGGAELTLDNGLILRVQADLRTTREDDVWWRQFRAAGSVVWVLRRQK